MGLPGSRGGCAAACRREALEERGLDVEGDEERVRQLLILAIQREDADLLLLDSTRSALEVGDGMEDAAFEEDYRNKWGHSDLADGARAFEPAAAAACASAERVWAPEVQKGETRGRLTRTGC